MTTTLTIPVSTRLARPLASQDHSGAATDDALVETWLATKRSPATRRAYAGDAEAFLAFLFGSNVTLRTCTVRTVQAWADALGGAPASRARRVSAIKSLLTFGQKTGYLTYNVGAVINAPHVPNKLSERILEEHEVQKMFASGSPNPRDVTLMRFLYASGARVSEACGAKWEHLHPRADGAATLTLHGKGGKTRHVVIQKSVVDELLAMRGTAHREQPIFATRSGQPMGPANVAKLVRQATKRTGLDREVTPHWFRHAHASHALDRGAPVSLVQASLGHASLATTGKYVHARPGDGAGMYLNL